MSLSDIMGSSGLSFYPIVAMVLFVVAFVAIAIYIFSRRNKETFARAKQIPLDDAVVMPRGEANATPSPAEVGHD